MAKEYKVIYHDKTSDYKNENFDGDQVIRLRRIKKEIQIFVIVIFWFWHSEWNIGALEIWTLEIAYLSPILVSLSYKKGVTRKSYYMWYESQWYKINPYDTNFPGGFQVSV